MKSLYQFVWLNLTISYIFDRVCMQCVHLVNFKFAGQCSLGRLQISGEYLYLLSDQYNTLLLPTTTPQR